MIHDCDTLIHVLCEHPDDSSGYYTFGVKYDDFNEEETRKEIERRVNRHGYWHEVKMWIEYCINGKVYKGYF